MTFTLKLPRGIPAGSKPYHDFECGVEAINEDWWQRISGARTMLVQRPDTLLKLWRFLHECAHLKMHRSVAPGTSYHLVELEADRYARDAIRDAGIEISGKFLCVRKEYLYSELLADLRAGYDMSPGIVEYMGWSEQEGLELVAIMRKLPSTKKHLRSDFAEKSAALCDH